MDGETRMNEASRAKALSKNTTGGSGRIRWKLRLIDGANEKTTIIMLQCCFYYFYCHSYYVVIIATTLQFHRVVV